VVTQFHRDSGAVTCQDGDVFTFVGGNLALDLVGTVAERSSEPVEQLATPRDVGEWFVAAGVLDRAPKVTTAEHDRVREVREAVHRLVTAHVAGRRLPTADRGLVNVVAAGTPPRVEVTAAGEVRRTGDVDAGLAAVARSFVQLLGEPDLLVRWCEGEACTRPFVDRSRGHRRRWCGMAGCGDRAKAAAYRARQRG
jgi:predicted RNA-binding Zn ribbon-like protein